MKICPTCSRANPDNSQFCEKCGARFTGNEEKEKGVNFAKVAPPPVRTAISESSDDKAVSFLRIIADEVASIRRWITFFGIATVIGMLIILLRSCM